MYIFLQFSLAEINAFKQQFFYDFMEQMSVEILQFTSKKFSALLHLDVLCSSFALRRAL